MPLAPGVWCCWPPHPEGGPLGVMIHTVLSASSAKNRCIWEKGGLCSGSRLQHRSISSYRDSGQAGGRDKYTYIVAAGWTEGREQMSFSSPETGSALPAPGPILCSDLPALVSEELPCILNDLFICQLPKGLGPAEHQHLPQSHPKGPNVTCCCELPLVCG